MSPAVARSRRRAAGIGGLIALVLMLGSGCEGGERGEGAPLEPLGPAPEFLLPLLAGGEVELAELRGKTVILDFWATWCGPCEVQMPILDALWRERGKGNLAIVGISVDTDPPAQVAAWVEERGFEYPIAFGDQELAMRYGILGFPSLILIDPEGRIQARHTGVWSREEIDERLESIERPSAGDAPGEG